MSRIAVASTWGAPLVCISNTTSSGVSATPRMLDSEALTIAADTWPRAIEVNAIDDCTVEGTRHKNSSPLYRSMLSTDGTNARAARPSTGNTTNVVASTSRCSRHCRSPCQACCGDNRVP
ncbi:hypothetical protein C1Y40_05708 [Mycobacterium talmoniae]|uniref:Uncharacterized protein n=1 Tax=Mycobacterium talmoniae TaxID=1858794 RepID=A0A2S8BBV4_9MYCO|nr:hypothetical protein C1Y40_05708 [Mycobacterium talmoniae]